MAPAGGSNRAMLNDTPSPPKSPRQTPGNTRQEREAAALRANLGKRKQQQRARALPADDEPDGLPQADEADALRPTT